MNVVVIGGTGLIGSKVVTHLKGLGHQVTPAALETGVNLVTGEGVAAAVAGADVVVDVSNSPSFADREVMEFFTTATGNLLEAARSAEVKHYVVLSVVGTGEVPDSGYLRAKAAQEELVAVSGVPYTIVRATQFFEFLPRMADDSVVDGKVHLPPVHFQPMSSDDVARAVAETAVAGALRGIREVGGPQRVRMDELVAEALRTRGDGREVVADPRATYFGAELDDDVLVPGPGAALSTTSYADWVLASR